MNDLKSKIRGKITKKVIRSFWGARSPVADLEWVADVADVR